MDDFQKIIYEPKGKGEFQRFVCKSWTNKDGVRVGVKLEIEN